MKINEVQRKQRKSVGISIRTTKDKSKFMKEKNISPNALFDKAITELMKEKK